jgi:hypothetical protein
MTKTVLLGFTALMAMSGAAFAQTTPAPAPAAMPKVAAAGTETTVVKTPEDGSQQNGPGIRAQLKGNLEKSGFTDVSVVADAYLVQATDKSGNRVTMFINPDSLTVITAGKSAGAPPPVSTKN